MTSHLIHTATHVCRRVSALAVLLVLTGFTTLYSQSSNPVCDKLVMQMENLARNNAPEMAYIQTSKGIYEIYEELWFKTYLLDAQ